jgi:cytochrome c-type biogenesis protein CcmH/NrfF
MFAEFVVYEVDSFDLTPLLWAAAVTAVPVVLGVLLFLIARKQKPNPPTN